MRISATGASEASASWFVMPRSPSNWTGAAALWVTVAGWAGAARRRYGADSPIITPGGVINETACLDATEIAFAAPAARRRRLGANVRQMAKDGQVLVRQRAYRRQVWSIATCEPRQTPQFIWAHHELFHTAGVELARCTGAPLVTFVHAPIIWEARRWGVRRRGWGSLLERVAELPALRRSDLIACVSDEVAQSLEDCGIDRRKLLVAPMAVDPERFCPGPDRPLRRIDAPLRVGWVGTFRKFHAVPVLLDAARQLVSEGCPVHVVLIGDGFERPNLEAAVGRLGLTPHVDFMGQVGNRSMPDVLASLDAAVVTAEAAQAFHYSPLKLREYMSMALPIVAPAIGEVGRLITNRQTGLLVAPGDPRALAAQLRYIAEHPAEAASIGAAARKVVVPCGTWDAMLDSAIDRLAGRSRS